MAAQRTVREVRGGRLGGRWEGGWMGGGWREGEGNSAKTSQFKETLSSEGKKRRLRRYQRDTGRSHWP